MTMTHHRYAYTRMTRRMTTRTVMPKIGNDVDNQTLDSGRMDGMVVQGGAGEWRGKAAR